jgi:hypothetical protein
MSEVFRVWYGKELPEPTTFDKVSEWTFNSIFLAFLAACSVPAVIVLSPLLIPLGLFMGVPMLVIKLKEKLWKQEKHS